MSKAPKKAVKKRTERRAFPYAKVAKLWADGKTIAEIAEAIDRVGEGKDPYHSLRVVLTRMHKGYRDFKGNVVKLPHRVSKKTLMLATKAGKRGNEKPGGSA